MTNAYQTAYDRSMHDREAFWAEAAEAVHWYKRWDTVLDESNKPFYRWFPGGEVNTCYNAIDRHVDAGRGDQAAIIHDSPVTGTVTTLTYSELLDKVSHFAGLLARLGVGKGDRVLLYMPMIPEAVIAMLATARIGAIHSVVFGGFAPHELATRINDCTPRVVVAASCGVEGSKVIPYKPLLDQAIDQSEHKPAHAVIFQRPQSKADLSNPRDVDWAEAVKTSERAPCVAVASTDPLYILYTSGTTGQPKGVVRDNGGHMVALMWTMRYFYNMKPGDVFWAASDVGWVVGHSYIVYGPLLYGATTLMYEGKPVGTPDPGAFWRVIGQHKVDALFTAPTALRAIKREDPNATHLARYDISSLKTLFLAGERSDPDTVRWAEGHLKVPVIDHWWQTETGWAIAGNCMGLHAFPIKPGSPTKPVPGWGLDVLDEVHEPCPPGKVGALVVRLPLPPGTLLTLWNADQRCFDAYYAEYPHFYKTADAGMIDEDGYVHVMARTDDIINVAGHRLSTGAMEEVLSSHPDVAECAVIGVADQLKGQVPVGFVCLKAGVTRPDSVILDEVVKLVRDTIGPVAAFKSCAVVPRLPKTRSGKILRGTMRKLADNEEFKTPATIDDPAILDEIGLSLTGLGLGKGRKD